MACNWLQEGLAGWTVVANCDGAFGPCAVKRDKRLWVRLGVTVLSYSAIERAVVVHVLIDELFYAIVGVRSRWARTPGAGAVGLDGGATTVRCWSGPWEVQDERLVQSQQ